MRVLIFVVLCAVSAFAADPFYFGTWKIESAKVAPWWTEHGGDHGVVYRRAAAGCVPAPMYQLRSSGADELFQGMLEEMHGRDKSADSREVAGSLGFRGAKVETVETGCGNESDFHFIDKDNAAFGLNNYIFYLKRMP